MVPEARLNSINIFDSSDVYNTYKDLYVSKEEGDKKLSEGIQSANGLKVWVGLANVDDLTFTTEENAIKENPDR